MRRVADAAASPRHAAPVRGRDPWASGAGWLLLGLALAYGFEGWQPDLLPGDHRVAGALFMGTAMAITAFPVLARILAERNLMGQPLGALAITAAALDDVVGWSLLAAVVAFSRSGSALGALPTLGGTALYATVLLLATAAGAKPLRSSGFEASSE